MYWYGSNSLRHSGKGNEESNAIHVVLNGTNHNIEKGDYLLKGAYNVSIASITDLDEYDYVTVESIEINDVGSVLDNTVLSCK